MLTRNLLRSIAALVALCGLVSSADAQIGSRLEGSSPLLDGSRDQFLADELGSYDGDLFTPVDFGDQLVKERFDNTGFFFTYDRVTPMYISSPSTSTIAGQTAPSFSIDTYGNRYEFGYMTDEDAGITASITYTLGSTFVAGRSSVGTPLPMQIASRYVSVEVNRTFRQPLKNGSLLEPYFGARYLGISDSTVQDGEVLPTNPNFPQGTNDRFLQEARNFMPGGQIGFRWFRNSGRWTVSTQGSLMAMYNDQRYFASDIINRTVQSNLVIERAASRQTFVPAGELRGDVAFHLTRDIALRVGGDLVYMGQGITRANALQSALNPNSINSGNTITGALVPGSTDDTILYGFTAGFEWRR